MLRAKVYIFLLSRKFFAVFFDDLKEKA